jgi:DNA-directed RNA polymerase subunit RPC12/RpoP
LTEKFFNAELEEKYKKKEKKDLAPGITIEEANGKNADDWWYKHYNTTYKCSKCGKDIKTFYEGYINDSKTGKPMCVQCYKKYLLEVVK